MHIWYAPYMTYGEFKRHVFFNIILDLFYKNQHCHHQDDNLVAKAMGWILSQIVMNISQIISHE